MKQLLLSHENIIQNQPNTNLSSSYASGVSSIVGDNIEDFFAVNSFIWIGYGKENGEIVRMTSINKTTNTIGITPTKYSHDMNESIYNIMYNQVEFSWSETKETNPQGLVILDLVGSEQETVYQDLLHTEGYGYVRLYNSQTLQYEPLYSGAIPYKIGVNTVAHIRYMAMENLGMRDNLNFADDTYIIGLMNSLESMYAHQLKRPLEVQEREYKLGSLAQGEWELNLPSNISDRYSPRSIQSVRLAMGDVLEFKFKNDFDGFLENTFYTTTTAITNIGATVINVSDSSGFNTDGGTALFGVDTITYTGISGNTLTGVTGVTVQHALGSLITSGLLQGKPQYYTVFNEKMYVYPIMGDEYAGKPIYIDYISKLGERIQSLYDNTIIEDTNLCIKWLEANLIRKDNQGAMTSGESNAMGEFERYLRKYLGNQGKGEKNVLKHHMDGYFRRLR